MPKKKPEPKVEPSKPSMTWHATRYAGGPEQVFGYEIPTNGQYIELDPQPSDEVLAEMQDYHLVHVTLAFPQ